MSDKNFNEWLFADIDDLIDCGANINGVCKYVIEEVQSDELS